MSKHENCGPVPGLCPVHGDTCMSREFIDPAAFPDGDLDGMTMRARDAVSMAANLAGGTVSKRTQVEVRQTFDNGRTLSTTWSEADFTEAGLIAAVANAPREAIDAPEREALHMRRIVLGPVTLYPAKEVGGPAWPWPKLLVRWRRGPEVIAGWRMTAYSVAVHRS